MQDTTFSAVLTTSYDIAPGVRHFCLEKLDGTPLDYIPGQFITLLFETDAKPVRRSYSIASIPGKHKTIDFAASYIPNGIASESLFDLKPGAQLKATGPFGRLVLRDETPKRYILVATGTGVTPYRSMLPELNRRTQEHGTEVVIIEGVTGKQNLIYSDDFLEYANQNSKKWQFLGCYSREEANIEEQAFARTGHVQKQFENLNLDPQGDIVYLCGNPNMIDQAFEQLQAMHFEVQNIRREKYISAK